MELIDPLRPQIEKSFFWLQITVLGGAALAAIFLLLQMVWGSVSEEKPSMLPVSFDYNRIGEGRSRWVDTKLPVL